MLTAISSISPNFPLPREISTNTPTTSAVTQATSKVPSIVVS